MQNKYFKNYIISFILIITIISMPFAFFPKKVEAQSIDGYISGLAPAIATLPQCKDIIGSGISDLFGGVVGGVSDLISSSNKDASDSGSSPSLEGVASEAGSSFDNVNVYDTEANKKLDALAKKTEAIKQSTESLNANSTCIQSIGRLVIKMLLQKLTVSTVKWINSGFDGAPAFVQDPGKFFGDIAKNEILQFGLEINDPELFPFGKAWLQNTATAFNKKFTDNAQYSLDKLIQETTPEFTAATFQEDFSQGGWNAWESLTQVPANNPLGFKLMADNEIQRRLSGTTQSTAQNVRDALQAANGFLGDQRCAYPEDVTKEEHTRFLNGEEGARECTGGFEYVTPGKLISEAATTAINYQNNAYLNVTDLNDAVAAILDALLSQFSSNIIEKGFANISDQGIDGTLVYDTSITDVYVAQTEKDFSPVQLASSWLTANPNFNIRTDLTQALIDEQRIYSDKLKEQDKELLSTTDGRIYQIDGSTGLSNAYGLIPTIYQLDYCIPGPHPGWEDDSRQALNAAVAEVLPETETSLKDKDLETIITTAKSVAMIGAMAAGAAIGSAVPILGTLIGAVVGVIVGFIIDLFSSSDDSYNVRAYYAYIIASYTGKLPNYDLKDTSLSLSITSKAGFTQIMNTILDRYIDIINQTYFSSPEILPTVARESETYFNQLTGYKQIIKNNEDKISLLQTTINTLGEIKDAIDNLNTQFEAGLISESDYEKDLVPQINAFGRLSSDMVNGDDIASADNILKQIKDKKVYIYNNLLKGSYGCEADLEKPQQKFPSVGHSLYDPNISEINLFPDTLLQTTDWGNFDVNSVKRANYPFEILYDYNHFTIEGSSLPDPENNPKIYENTVPANEYATYGPGFLSFVFFGSHPAFDRSNILKISDLFPTGTEVKQYNFRALGLRKEVVNIDPNTINSNQNQDFLSGPFEPIIGVY